MKVFTIFLIAVTAAIFLGLARDNRVDASNSAFAPTGPVGTIVAYAGPVVDTGRGVQVVPDWYLCNGAALRKADFMEIWNVVKTHYGNGSDDSVPETDFNLPDLRGVFLRGWNGVQTDQRLKDPDAATRTFNNPGAAPLSNVGTFQADEAGPHTHAGQTPPIRSFSQGDSGGGSHMGQLAGGNPPTGLNSGRESRPKNVAVNYIIRVR